MKIGLGGEHKHGPLLLGLDGDRGNRIGGITAPFKALRCSAFTAVHSVFMKPFRFIGSADERR